MLSPRPGIALGPYPERDPDVGSDPIEGAMHGLATAPWRRQVLAARQARFLQRTRFLGATLEGLSASALRALVVDLRAALTSRRIDPELMVRSFAITREMAGRVLGMRHYPAQMVGGRIVASGMLAEMPTGEGKTLTATLPAAFVALAGVPVHVITANDYLARRDAAAMAPLYRALGLSVGVAGQGDSADARRSAYARDITYCTASQVAFDYLHDKLLRGTTAHKWQLQTARLRGRNSGLSRLLLRGLCFAVVDEADSILIDEARTPLILSRRRDTRVERDACIRSQALAGALRRGIDYVVDEREGRVELSDPGRARLAELAAPHGGGFAGARYREFMVHQALWAGSLLRRDRDYIVRDGKVVIVDHNTGRPMPDRSWEQGLQQMVEVKEGCEISATRETLARTTYQRFFNRYLRLGGMSGTAREVSWELRTVYRLDVVSVAAHRPCRRVTLSPRVFSCRQAKWQAVAARAQALRQQGRPVLIGTRSVEESEGLSAYLRASGIDHQLLNARQDRDEAEVVARAGEAGRVTVATNMAGRGTDIALGIGVADSGGLHVIVAECNDAARIDRQLVGRAARQGEPGSCEILVSLDDALVERHGPRALRALARVFGVADGAVPATLGVWLVRHAQRAEERRHAAARRLVRRLDEQLADALAFAGRGA